MMRDTTQSLERRAFVERSGEKEFTIVDPVFSRWLARRTLPPTLYVLPLGQRKWLVTNGPSLAFTHSMHKTRDEAEARANEELSQQSRGGTISVFDVDTRDELPELAQGASDLPS